MIKGLKRDMETQNKESPPTIQQQKNRKRARDEFLFLKSSLNKIENEKTRRATESAQAKFLNEGERCSKYCLH